MRSEEYEELSKKITGIRADVEELKAIVSKLSSDIANQRGYINRKLSNMSRSDTLDNENKQPEKAENIKSPEPVVFTGMHGINISK